MTITHDPSDPRFLDEADVRHELTRVFDVCDGCRACIDLCPTFPDLFDRIAHRSGAAGNLTPADQDAVVDSCWQCDRCSRDCPYVPALDERAIDVPRLMLRAKAMIAAGDHRSMRVAATAGLMARPARNGAIATRIPLVARTVAADPGTVRRRVLGAVTGVSPVRLLPPFAQQRFSTWFAARAARTDGTDGDDVPAPDATSVTLWPTCLVEYHEPAIGRDLVEVYRRNGIECALTGAGCCGAAQLHQGDVDGFRTLAGRNVAVLASELGDDGTVVVPQASCRAVVVEQYPTYLGTPDAARVAARTVDASQFLLDRHAERGIAPMGDLGEPTGRRVTYHRSCHSAVSSGLVAGVELLRLAGLQVEVVEGCSGSGGAWGLQSRHAEVAVGYAAALGAMIDDAGSVVDGSDAPLTVGDCHVANTAIAERTGRRVLHPLQVLARFARKTAV